MPEAFLYLVPSPLTQAKLKQNGFSPTGYLPSHGKSYGGCHITFGHPMSGTMQQLQHVVDAAAAAGPIKPFRRGSVDKRDSSIRSAEEAACAAGWPRRQLKNFGNYHCAIGCYMVDGSSPAQAEACLGILRDPNVCWGFILSVKTSGTTWTFDDSSFRPCGAGYLQAASHAALVAPEGQWTLYSGVNCYPGYNDSAVWIESDQESRSRGKMTVEEAQEFCRQVGAVAFTYDQQAGIVWPLREVNPSRGKENTRYDLYVAPSDWQKYAGVNCYPGYNESATWMESDQESRSRGAMTLQEAQAFCRQVGAVAFTYDQEAGTTWPLREVNPSGGKQNTQYDLYIAPSHWQK